MIRARSLGCSMCVNDSHSIAFNIILITRNAPSSPVSYTVVDCSIRKGLVSDLFYLSALHRLITHIRTIRACAQNGKLFVYLWSE